MSKAPCDWSSDLLTCQVWTHPAPHHVNNLSERWCTFFCVLLPPIFGCHYKTSESLVGTSLTSIHVQIIVTQHPEKEVRTRQYLLNVQTGKWCHVSLVSTGDLTFCGGHWNNKYICRMDNWIPHWQQSFYSTYGPFISGRIFSALDQTI